VLDKTKVPTPSLVNAVVIALLDTILDKVKVSLVAFCTVIVAKALATLLPFKLIKPLSVLVALALFSNKVAVVAAVPFKLMLLATVRLVPLNARVAPAETTAELVAEVPVPKAVLLASVKVPAVTLNVFVVLVVSVFALDKINVPTPPSLKVTALKLFMPDKVKLSAVALETLAATVPLNESAPLKIFAPLALLSESVLPVLKVILLATLSARPESASVPLMVAAEVPIAEELPRVKVPADTSVVPV